MELAERGWHVRRLVRNRDRAEALAKRGMEFHEGDVLEPETLHRDRAGDA